MTRNDRDPIVFRVLLALFPREFRDAFGSEMRQVFAAQQRDARKARAPWGIARLWLRTAAGMTVAAWRERRQGSSPRARIDPPLHWTDLRHAARRLAAAPGFTFVAVATLAICLAANLAIFAVVNSILLRPLPLPGADRLVTIYNTYPKAGVMDDGASIANYYERRGRLAAFSDVALYRDDAVIVGETGSTEREFVMRVTPDFFATLGMAPALGRTFREEETSFDASSVVILSEPYWRQQFAGDSAAVGRTLRINGSRYTIVGVLPRGFSFLSSRARIFLPLASGSDDRASARRHSGSSSRMVARLAPGVTLGEAQAQIDAQNAVLEREDAHAAMIADAGFRSVVVGLQDRHVASARQPLFVVQAGAAALLLIGLVNLANLLLIRTVGRAREFAVRRAVGARAAHLLSTVFAETLLLSLAGSAFGLLIAQTAIGAVGTLGAARLPLAARIAVDGTTAIAAVGAAIGVALLLGAGVAWHAVAAAAAGGLHADARAGGTRHTQRTRHGFAIAQIALSLVLLCGATMLGLTLRALQSVDRGFRSEQLLSGQVSLPWMRYRTDALRLTFIDRLVAELRRTPGVAAAGLSTNVPLSGSTIKSAVSVGGRPLRPGERPRAIYHYAVAGDYFAAMAIPLVEGRYLTAQDVRPGARVCVVDEDFAKRVFPGGNVLGQRLFVGPSEGPPEDGYTIIGVVSAVKQASLSEADRTGAVYYPYSSRFDSALYVVVRSTIAPDALQAEIRRAVRGIDPELPVNNVRTMDARVADSLTAQRSPAILGGVFSAVALLLTGLGTYGVLSYGVAQRRREIGVRLALGARPREVQLQFVRVGLRLVAAGLSLGIAGGWVVARLLRASVAGSPEAPFVPIAVASVLLGLTCLAACVLPARRAARTSPLAALQQE